MIRGAPRFINPKNRGYLTRKTVKSYVEQIAVCQTAKNLHYADKTIGVN